MDITKVTTDRDDLLAVVPSEDDLQKAPQRATRGRHASQVASRLSEPMDAPKKAPRALWGLTSAFIESR